MSFSPLIRDPASTPPLREILPTDQLVGIPQAHNHVIADIAVLQAALDAKAAANMSNVSNADFLAKATVTGVGSTAGLAAANLSNVANADFLAKATAAGVGASNGPTLPVTTTSSSLTMSPNVGYVAAAATRLTLTLPAALAVGQTFEVYSFGSGGWKIAQSAGQSIIFGPVTTTAGVSDGLQSAGGGAYARLVAITTTVLEVVAFAGPVAQTGATTQSFDPTNKSQYATLSAANTVVTTSQNTNGGVRGYACPVTGKYYFELVVTQTQGRQSIGFCTSSQVLTGSNENSPHAYTWYYGYDVQNPKFYTAGVGVVSPNAAQGDVLGVAVDFSAGKVWFAKNGVWQAGGNPAAGTGAAMTLPGGQLYPLWCFSDSAGQAEIATIRFSPGNWSFPAPTEFMRMP